MFALRLLLGIQLALIPLGAAGISPSKLEINLGPFPMDRYLDPSPNGGILPACGNSNWSVRDCVKNMFNNNPGNPPYTPNNYIAQGVTGVRFFYTLGGVLQYSVLFEWLIERDLAEQSGSLLH